MAGPGVAMGRGVVVGEVAAVTVGAGEGEGVAAGAAVAEGGGEVGTGMAVASGVLAGASMIEGGGEVGTSVAVSRGVLVGASVATGCVGVRMGIAVALGGSAVAVATDDGETTGPVVGWGDVSTAGEQAAMAKTAADSPIAAARVLRPRPMPNIRLSLVPRRGPMPKRGSSRISNRKNVGV